MIFATPHQLDLLNRANSWYVDTTFKFCSQPVTQLLTINAFVKADDYAKQVPLVFVLMSGKKKSDYRGVKKLPELLPSPAVKQVMLDFKCTMRKVLGQLLPDVKLLGCLFHWTQAMWRKRQFENFEFFSLFDYIIINYFSLTWFYLLSIVFNV